MSNVALEHTTCIDDEDHLLRRAGEAVAVLWNHMPEPLRVAILNQAETLAFRTEASEARQRLRAFLETYHAAAR